MRFVIDPDHPCLRGHFPGHPLVPGVVLLDRVLAALADTWGEPAETRWPQVKFVQPLLPGQAARVELEGEGASRRFRVLRECDGALLAGGVVEAVPA